MRSENLRKAKSVKNDEFYTRLSDIEKELQHYTHAFDGKTVFCNCDDYRKSKFYTYFRDNFETLGLKKLITVGFQSDGGIQMEYTPGEMSITQMEGNGSFDSPESLALLEESDIVVTNPPFSLFRAFVDVMVHSGKKYLIIGNLNAVSYKNIFPLIKDNKMWLGVNYGGMTFDLGEKS